MTTSYEQLKITDETQVNKLPSLSITLIIVLLMTAVISGCFSKDPPATPATIINAEVLASDVINPDGEGRPSPIVVRIYELKNLGTFNTVEFFPLYNEEAATFGDDLVYREEFSLIPGSKKLYTRTPTADTQYLAVIAAFRNIDQATWKAVVPIPTERITNLIIQLDRLTVSIRAE
jgi:type VI secretion system protein VasD